MKIGVMGIGAIGGYISAMLCKSKENVYVIGKGETLNIIKEKCLMLIFIPMANHVMVKLIGICLTENQIYPLYRIWR